MTQPSPKQAGQKFNQLQNRTQSRENLTRENSQQLTSSRQQQKSLKTKAIAWSVAIGMIPVLAVGITTYYLGSQSITKQISSKANNPTDVAETEAVLTKQLSLLLIATGITSALAGAIAAIVANRAIRPVLDAAETSSTIANRLFRESSAARASVAGKDELGVLETNLALIKKQLPTLLWRRETEAEYTQVSMHITRCIWKSLNEEDVLKTTVEEMRKALKADRVGVFRFNPNWDGTFVAESVASGVPKVLWTTIADPCFTAKYVEQYRKGRIRVINNIYQAELNDCHIGLLERFAVKSNMVAPIFKNDQLFGLLIAHQCSEPRDWQQPEINLFTNISTQIGFVLNYTKLLERVETKVDQAQVVIDITRRIRTSLNEEDVLKTTVEEVRKALSTDRVLVYGFDSDWYGTVIAESVLPGFPKALRARIKDPCFAQGYVDKYQAGRVQAINNIYEAGLTDCHISQLEPFAVKANLVAPILKDDKLFGLLIAHQCSDVRDWQRLEIDWFAQIATQVGFALDHARLLDQVDQAYQLAEATSVEQHKRQQEFQRQLFELLRSSENVVQSLSTEVGINQMESVRSAYNQIQLLADSAQSMLACIQQVKIQEQQLSETVQNKCEFLNQISSNICAIQETVVEAAEKVNYLNQPSQKLSDVVSLMGSIISQMKLQVMHTALEASRCGEAGQKFALIAEKVLSLVQQLDSDVAEIKPIVEEIQTEMYAVIEKIQSGTEQASSGMRLIEETQQKLGQLVAINNQMTTLVTELAKATTVQAQTSSSANQSILGVATIASQTSEKALAVAESFSKLMTAAQDFQEGVD